MSILNKILKTFVGDKSKKDIRAIQHLLIKLKKIKLNMKQFQTTNCVIKL